MNEENQELTKQQKAQQAGKDIADTAARAAATYAGGAAGAKLYDAASKTKLGQGILNHAGNKAAKRPFVGNRLAKMQPAIEKNKSTIDSALGGSNSKLKDSNSKTSLDSLVNSNGGEGTFSFKKTKLYIGLIVIICLIVMILFFVTIIVNHFDSAINPQIYINDMFSETGTKLKNLFSGCGWSTEAECQEKLNNDFYDEIIKVYDEYKREKSVELDKNLLVTTLTYVDPYLTVAPENEDAPSSTIDYKKSRKQVKILAENMVREIEYCYLLDKETEGMISTDCSNDSYDKDKYKLKKTKTWVLDIEKYRNYLETNFVIKYYLNNNRTEEAMDEAIDITDEIFERVEFYNYLDGNNRTETATFSANNTMVNITDSNGIFLEQVSLPDYLNGVVYAQMDKDSDEEYLKFVAVAAKNYLYSINGASINSSVQILNVKNSEVNQIYCSVSKGCHYRDGSGNENDVMLSGEDNDGIYYKPPLDDMNIIRKIRNAVDSTTSEFVVNNGNLVLTKYNGDNKNEVLDKLKNNNYQEVLASMYGGTINQLNLYVSGYPLDIEYINVTSGFGWRFHPTQHVCKHHNGTDIAASSNANIYSIADGVVTYVGNMPSKINGLGNYVIIGHGVKTGIYYEYYSLYAHMIRPPVVSVGDNVKSGQLIGNVGTTGASTGNHLHIEIYSYPDNLKVRTDATLYFKNVQLKGDTGAMYSSKEECQSYN